MRVSCKPIILKATGVKIFSENKWSDLENDNSIIILREDEGNMLVCCGYDDTYKIVHYIGRHDDSKTEDVYFKWKCVNSRNEVCEIFSVMNPLKTDVFSINNIEKNWQIVFEVEMID